MGRPKKEPPKAFHFIELQAYFHAIQDLEESMANKHTAVMARGKQYKSIAAAFMALGLPMARHQLFRKKLKAEKTAEFEGIVFTVVE